MELVILGGVAFNELSIMPHIIINDVDMIGTYTDVCEYVKNLKMTAFYPTKSGKKLIVKFIENEHKVIIDAEIAWKNSVAEKILEIVKNDKNTKVSEIYNSFKLYFPSLNFLYMMKMSHRYLKNSPHFLKTLQDIEVMRYFGAVIQPEHEELYKIRMKDTYNYSHPKLNTSKNNFFKDIQIYRFDHDQIHAIMAHLEKPAYEYYKPNQSEVNVSKELFFSVDEKIRLYGAIEEVYVLALERSQIPSDFTIEPKWSFDKSLEQLATSVSSGFFREFVWENYYKIQSMYDPNYVEKFKQAVVEERIKKL